MNYVKHPNLPDNAKIVLIGEKYAEKIGKKLSELGIETLPVPENPYVDPRVCCHADLSVIHAGGDRLILAPYLKGSALERELRKLGMELYFPDIKQGNKYPEDAVLNICICGNRIIYNEKTVPKAIVDNLTKAGDPIKVRQGYSKCSVCVVSESTIITSDPGIHKRAVEYGLDSLKISQGSVTLDGFDYGFIGGASFKLSRNELAFTGNLNEHPDRASVIEFLSLHNIIPVYMTEEVLFDIGSVIQIVEK